MKSQPWQIRLFSKSLMKKEKVRLIRHKVNFLRQRVVELGCAQGTVSYQLQKGGGDWIHCDTDLANLKSAQSLLKKNLAQIEAENLPFKERCADIVLALDFLEHVDRDDRVLREAHRILGENGRIVVSTPISGRFFLLNRIKRGIGLKPEIFGHKREGYGLSQLASLLEENGFRVEQKVTYAKFFVEIFEMTLDFAYFRKNRTTTATLRTGSISPSSANDLERHRRLFAWYAYAVYPILYLVSRLDRLLFFKTGYATLLIGRKK
jgi:SAM-dependent methyltransferase